MPVGIPQFCKNENSGVIKSRFAKIKDAVLFLYSSKLSNHATDAENKICGNSRHTIRFIKQAMDQRFMNSVAKCGSVCHTIYRLKQAMVAQILNSVAETRGVSGRLARYTPPIYLPHYSDEWAIGAGFRG